MRAERVLLTSFLFVIYVFIFPDIVTAIEAINPLATLYPVLRVIPYVLGVVVGVLPVYFAFSDGDSK